MKKDERLAQNLKYLLWDQKVERNVWIRRVSEIAECSEFTAADILKGLRLPSMDELNRISEVTNISAEELLYSPLINPADVLLNNLRFLIDSLGHGGQKEFSTSLGVNPTTVSKWKNGEQQRPSSKHLSEIKKYFCLDTSLDLKSEPIFLSLEPVGTLGKREWLKERIAELSDDVVNEIYPALKRMFK